MFAKLQNNEIPQFAYFAL